MCTYVRIFTHEYRNTQRVESLLVTYNHAPLILFRDVSYVLLVLYSSRYPDNIIIILRGTFIIRSGVFRQTVRTGVGPYERFREDGNAWTVRTAGLNAFFDGKRWRRAYGETPWII